MTSAKGYNWWEEVGSGECGEGGGSFGHKVVAAAMYSRSVWTWTENQVPQPCEQNGGGGGKARIVVVEGEYLHHVHAERTQGFCASSHLQPDTSYKDFWGRVEGLGRGG